MMAVSFLSSCAKIVPTIKHKKNCTRMLNSGRVEFAMRTIILKFITITIVFLILNFL